MTTNVIMTLHLLLIRQRIDAILIQAEHALQFSCESSRSTRNNSRLTPNLQYTSECVVSLEGANGRALAPKHRHASFNLHISRARKRRACGMARNMARDMASPQANAIGSVSCSHNLQNRDE
jgi:hypothetical protein